jgi:hypothetical protein
MSPSPRRTIHGLPLEPDPVIEAYKRDVDRTLLRENLKKTPDQRVRDVQALHNFAAEMRRAGERAWRQRHR